METFDLDSSLSGVSKFIGVLPWVSETSVVISRLGVWSGEGYEGHSVVVADNHGLKGGDRAFIGGFGPTIDHFYEVVDHPIPENRGDAFLIKLAASQYPSEESAVLSLSDGELRTPKKYSILHKQHLDLASNIAMRDLQTEYLKVLRSVSPENYRKTMSDILASISGQPSYVTLQGQLNVCKSTGRFTLADNQGYQTAIATAEAAIDAVFNESQALAQLDFESLDPKEAEEKMEAFGQFEATAKEKIAIAEAYLSSEQSEEIDPDIVAQVKSAETTVMSREIEILCNMPEGLMMALSGMVNITSVIFDIHQFINEKMMEADQAASSGQPQEETEKKQPKRRSRKGSTTTATISKAS